MDMERELLKGNTPTMVLAILGTQPLHGYGLAREIERRSANVLQFKDGTLYPVLHSLEQQGLIVGTWDSEGGGRVRKVYSLTKAGQSELGKRTLVWRKFTAAISSVIGGSEHEQPA